MPRSVADIFQVAMIVCAIAFLLALVGAFGEDEAADAIRWSIFGGFASLIGFSVASAREDARDAEAKRAQDEIGPPGDHIFNAVAQMLLTAVEGQQRTTDSLLLGDGMLQGYRTERIDWRGIWEIAQSSRVGIPTYNEEPYWVSEAPGGNPIPISQLAFYGIDDRRHFAEDRGAPDLLLELLAQDRDPTVADAAKRTHRG